MDAVIGGLFDTGLSFPVLKAALGQLQTRAASASNPLSSYFWAIVKNERGPIDPLDVLTKPKAHEAFPDFLKRQPPFVIRVRPPSLPFPSLPTPFPR